MTASRNLGMSPSSVRESQISSFILSNDDDLSVIVISPINNSDLGLTLLKILRFGAFTPF